MSKSLSVLLLAALLFGCEKAAPSVKNCEIPSNIVISSPRAQCEVWKEAQAAFNEAKERMIWHDRLVGIETPNIALDSPLYLVEQPDVFQIGFWSVVGVFAPQGDHSTVMWVEKLESEYHALPHELGHYLWWRRYGGFPLVDASWGEVGHGTPSDPFVVVVNATIDWFINIPNVRHPYHPGHLPSVNSGMGYFTGDICVVPFVSNVTGQTASE